MVVQLKDPASVLVFGPQESYGYGATSPRNGRMRANSTWGDTLVKPRARAGTEGVIKSKVIFEHRSADSLGSHYEVERELGAGSFGRVSLVKDRTLSEKRVYKTVSTKGLSRFIIDLMKKEVELLRKLDHPSIVRLFEYAEDPQKEELGMVLEYIPDGDCTGLLKKVKPEPLAEALVGRLALQLFDALDYCHMRGVIHRDVKPANMMLVYPPQCEDEPDVKLIDFGLAEGGVSLMRDYVGSPVYMPPELHRREKYTSSVDIWSAGITVLELLQGEVVQFPQPWEKTIGCYKSFNEFEAILKQTRGHWADRSDEAKSFVRHLLRADAAKRPEAQIALEHPWIESHRPEIRKFPKRVARSLHNHTTAHPVVRCCLFSIAARTGAADSQLAHAFLGADSDGDGLISLEDLEEALSDLDGYKWWWDPVSRLRAEEVLAAANLDHRGCLNFTEFVAAAITDRYENLEQLCLKAFYALDADRNGLLQVADLRKLFRERDRPFLDALPQDEGITKDVWCQRISDYIDSVESTQGDGSFADSDDEPDASEFMSPFSRGACCVAWS
eukprot:TRINITY_DN105350_c0_g1_i1.p1 TRINITY_DN105350_c0_g1~~TRINITY_DN105350_c0_g1_i1.p1  ORF type:complete len:572 (-),score=106.06 TRINITY_DN105350_c0_g1_i1:40-1710(-)